VEHGNEEILSRLTSLLNRGLLTEAEYKDLLEQAQQESAAGTAPPDELGLSLQEQTHKDDPGEQGSEQSEPGLVARKTAELRAAEADLAHKRSELDAAEQAEQERIRAETEAQLRAQEAQREELERLRAQEEEREGTQAELERLEREREETQAGLERLEQERQQVQAERQRLEQQREESERDAAAEVPDPPGKPEVSRSRRKQLLLAIIGIVAAGVAAFIVFSAVDSDDSPWEVGQCVHVHDDGMEVVPCTGGELEIVARGVAGTSCPMGAIAVVLPTRTEQVCVAPSHETTGTRSATVPTTTVPPTTTVAPTTVPPTKVPPTKVPPTTTVATTTVPPTTTVATTTTSSTASASVADEQNAILTAEYAWGSGDMATALQELLGITADGLYGPGTRAAHLAELERRGLPTSGVPIPPTTTATPTTTAAPTAAPTTTAPPCPDATELQVSIESLTVTQVVRDEYAYRAGDTRQNTSVDGILRVVNPTQFPATYRLSISLYQDMYADDVWRLIELAWFDSTDWTIGSETTIEHPVDGGTHITREYDQPEDRYRFEIYNLLAWFTC
jgi:hypothetical protein